MLFNSYIFFLFFIIVMILYVKLPLRGQNRMLLFASYVFYGYWDWRFLSLLFISTIIDYFVTHKIFKVKEKSKKKKYLLISIIANLGILGFFKYYGFFITEFQHLLQTVNFTVSLPILKIVLPVGISFYTFQTMSYTIDVYRNQNQPVNKVLKGRQ